jgi:transcriptional regulator with XRE-family HTH domain
MGEKPKLQFATTVREHLRHLGIEQRQLAEALGVKPSQVSAWLAEEENEGYRAVSVDTVGRIADFLKDQYQKRDVAGSDEFGKRKPFELAKRLLEAARLKLPFPTNEDSIWWRIKSDRAAGRTPTLRVGWYKWGNFADKEFTGLSRIITDELLRLMDLKMEPVPLHSYSAMNGFLENEKVDMIAPLMLAPFRMFQFWCSSPIGKKCGLNLLGVRKHVEPLLSSGKGPVGSIRELDGSKFRICFVAGGVAQVLGPQLRGGPRPETYNNVLDTIDTVLNEPIDPTGVVRLYCGDQFNCLAQEEANKEKGVMLLLRRPYNEMPLVFGVAPGEEGLLFVINQTIKLMLPWTREMFKKHKFG